MNKKHRYSLFLRTLALIMAIGLLIGAIPAAAIESDAPAEDESVSPAVEETPAEEETVVPDDQKEADADADKDSDAHNAIEMEAKDANEGKMIVSKDEVELAEVAEAPSGVDISIDDYSNSYSKQYNNYADYYYTGIESITITFTKPEELSDDQIKAVFDQDLSETDDYDTVDWWDKYGNLAGYKHLSVDEHNFVTLKLDIEDFVNFRYTSDGFSDEKADGTYTLVFPYDVDGEGKPVLYSREFVITNKKPVIKVTSTDAGKWIKKGEIKYQVESAVTGIKKVSLWKSKYDNYNRSYQESDTFTINESGQYYLTVKDNLGLTSEKVDAGEFKIDAKEPTIETENITYPESGDPTDPDSWSNDSVDVTFTVTTGGSGVKEVKPEGKDPIKPDADGVCTLRFEDSNDIVVTVTSNSGVKSKPITITAPHIDKVKPDNNSITHIGFSTKETSKIMNLLTFGIYGNAELLMTVYTEDESAIKEIEVVNSEDNPNKITKVGEIERNGKQSSQTFSVPVGSTKQNSDFSDINIKLTDLAGNTSDTTISWKDIKRFTAASKDTVISLENTDGKVKELVNTKLTPDVKNFKVTGESSETKPDYYRNNVEITADIEESLTGIADVKAYFGTESDFTFDEEKNEYKENETAKDIQDKITVKKKDGDKIESCKLDYKPNDDDLPTGKYYVLIKAKNNSGNAMQQIKEFYIDKEAPEIKIDPLPTTWASNNKITFTVTDKPDKNNVGIDSVVMKSGDETVPATKVSEGKYEFTPQEGKNYTVVAKDLLQNEKETDTNELTYDKIKFDSLAPKIGEFKYYDSNGDEMTQDDQWSDKVTVTFTIDDSITVGDTTKNLSGFDNSDLIVVKKVGEAAEPATKIDVTMTPVKENDNNRYECSFEVPDNFAKYSVKVKDNAENESEVKYTKVINRDNKGPVVDRINFKDVVNKKQFGVYGEAVQAVVYVKSGYVAPVADIQLKERVKGEDDSIDYDDIPRTETEVQKEYNGDGKVIGYYNTFLIPKDREFKNLCVYAESMAGVPISDNAVNGYVSISDIDVYVDDVALAKDKELFEAVSKDVGPAIEIDYSFTAEKQGNAYGYQHDENGNVIVGEDGLAKFNYKVSDSVAGVRYDTITVYFDTIDKFTPDKGVYKPDMSPGKTPRKIGEDFDREDNGDNENSKNTESTGSYVMTEAVKTGTYVLCVTADNLSNAESIDSVIIEIDDSAPVIDSISYQCERGDPTTTWVNEDVTVSFKVTDQPSGLNAKNCGVDASSIKITGAIDGDDYTEGLSYNEDTQTYSFHPSYAQEYLITAKDNYGSIAEEKTTAKILIDTEDPNVTISDLSTYQSDWTPKTKRIYFTVDDLSAYSEFSGEQKELSGIESIIVKDDSKGNTYPITPETVKTAKSTTYYFEADKYDNYTITVKDATGNETENKELKNIAIDNDDPYFTEISFSPHESTVDKILNFLTFGLYVGSSVDMTVKAEDDAPSSRIDDISLKGVGSTKNIAVSGGKPDKSEATAVFVINPEAITNSTNIELTVSDQSTLKSTKTLAQAYADGLIKVPDGFAFLNDEFEFKVSKERPDITGLKITPKEGVTEKSDNNGIRWFSGDVDIDFSVTDDTTYLHAIDIQMNNQSIRDKSLDDDKNTIPAYYTVYDAPASAEGNITTPVTYKHITIDSSKLGNIGNRISQNGSGNTLAIRATANNGLYKDDSAFYQIDDVAPDITAFSFDDTVDENSREKVDETERKEISDAMAKAGSEYQTMTSDNYVYFFQDEAVVTVSATDTHSGIEGSGVREIHFYAVGRTDPDDDVGIVMRDSKTVDDNFGNMSATFTVPAGFKGSIFAYAVDQVKNYGSQYSPNNLVVENKDLHDSNSDINITINTESVATDNNDHPLYDGDVSLTFTVEDKFSGIRSVSYSCNGLEESAYLEGSAFVDGDGDVSDDSGSWDINETDKNLVLNMSKTITLDGDGAFNSNDIEIKISGYDCSGYAIAEETKTISIDTTKPEIEVSYSPAKGSGNTYGSDEYEYYKESRTMNVTVYERNFDPSGFDYSGIVNKYVSGDVPALNAGDHWDTAYSDYSDTSAHSCSFTFSNDGDYEITLNCTDEAGNKADEYVGEKFTIDTIDPTIEVSLSGSAKNGKYYNETVTATVTVHEHNFAEGDTYVTFTPKTDFDTSYDKSSATPSISGWSGSGDTHTTTIDFSSDGTYSFTFDYKDKALRTAQQFSQTEFVVDKNIDKLIKFIDVADTTAYDGKIAPKVSFDDTNLDTVSSSMTRISLDTTDMKQSSTPASNLKHALNPASGSSRTDSYENFPEELVNDGIYQFEASGTDLAGNSKSEKILFSVNRFGSTFMLSTQSREWVETGYVNKANQLDVIEINVNEVKDQNVSVTRNSHTETLKSDNYKISSAGDTENWYRYNYNVYDSNFKDDGEYTVTVSSTDTFKKSVSNRTAVNDTEKGIEKNCPISFVMDTDDPIIEIDGVESDTPYGDPERTVNIICADANIEADTLVIKDDDEELVNGTDYTMEELAGELDIELVVDKPGKHTLTVFVADKATNNNSDEVANFELNASIFTLFFHNTVAVICTAIGLAAVIVLVVFLILKKKKKEDEQKAPSASK